MHDGLHIYEDGFIVQIVDPETGEPLPDGELGSLVHHRAVQDRQPAVPLQHHGPLVSVPARAVRVRLVAAKMGPFAGRGDNMVKLRGINVWPEGVGEIACAVDGVDARLLRAGVARREPRRDGSIVGRERT